MRSATSAPTSASSRRASAATARPAPRSARSQLDGKVTCNATLPAGLQTTSNTATRDRDRDSPTTITSLTLPAGLVYLALANPTVSVTGAGSRAAGHGQLHADRRLQHPDPRRSRVNTGAATIAHVPARSRCSCRAVGRRSRARPRSATARLPARASPRRSTRSSRLGDLTRPPRAPLARGTRGADPIRAATDGHPGSRSVLGMSTAKMNTTAGTIALEFFDDDAPKTVENFRKLSADGFYDGDHLPPRDPGLHDPGRLPRGHRHRRPRLHVRGRVQPAQGRARRAGDGQRRARTPTARSSSSSPPSRPAGWTASTPCSAR